MSAEEDIIVYIYQVLRRSISRLTHPISLTGAILANWQNYFARQSFCRASDNRHHRRFPVTHRPRGNEFSHLAVMTMASYADEMYIMRGLPLLSALLSHSSRELRSTQYPLIS
jgi:hypothetical protein